jgi:hypothetical protein
MLERRFSLRDLLRRSPGLNTSDAIASQWTLAVNWAEVPLRLSKAPQAECPSVHTRADSRLRLLPVLIRLSSAGFVLLNGLWQIELTCSSRMITEPQHMSAHALRLDLMPVATADD